MGRRGTGRQRFVGALSLLAVVLGVGAGVPVAAVAASHTATGASATATAATSSAPTATAAASPTVSSPGTSPFSQGVNPLSPTPTPTTTSATPTVINTTAATGGSSTFSTGDAIGIAIGAALLIGGIGFFIWRDARRRAPAPRMGADGLAAAGRRTGSKPPPKPRKLSPAERRRRKRGRARR